jgi:two-component system OmpR family sensor kinase
VSIFSKITILFIASIVLMGFLSSKTNELLSENIESAIKTRYLQSSQVLYDGLTKGDLPLVLKRAKELGYANFKIDKNIKKTVVYKTQTSFGLIEVFKSDNLYYLHLKYLDDEICFVDPSQQENTWQKRILNFFLSADIIILIIMFAIILGILRPIKNISKGIEKFGDGNYRYRLKLKNNKNDEITKLKKQFNVMAQNIESLIVSREQLLTDISHELRTPIVNIKLSLEMIEADTYKKSIQKSIEQIEILVNEVLNIERIRSGNLKLNIENIGIGEVLLDALSKIFADESEIKIEHIENFYIEADKDYVSIAIKNLIENALKYKIKGPVELIARDNVLEIKNYSNPLANEIKYYVMPFTRGDVGKKGYGLGLNIVKRIVEYHRFELKYDYAEGKSIFKIIFKI